MAERLKNILAFDLAPAASITIPHGLNTGVTGPRPLAPDIIFVPSPELEVVSDAINVTLTNRSPSPISGSILVEAWHTIERAFADVNDEDLPVKPYIVVSPEGGNQPDQPPFDQVLFTIYARPAPLGNDTTGDGSLAKPYATFQRAVRDVPNVTPPGAIYRVDITGITETLPPDYTLPAWKSPDTDNGTDVTTNPYTIFQAPVEIFAKPRPVASMPLADTIINPGDVASVTVDPITGLRVVNLTAPRASWTSANLKGKQVLDGAVTVQNTVVAEVISTSSIRLANASTPTFPLQLVEPSAWLHGAANVWGTIRVMNVDCLGFTGIKITSDNGFNGIYADGNGSTVCQLCELQSPFLGQAAGAIFFGSANRTVRCWVYGTATFAGIAAFVQSLGDALLWQGFDLPLFCAPVTVTIRRAVFIGCDPLEVAVYEPGGNLDGAATPHLVMQNTLVKNGTDDGLLFHGVKGHLTRVDFAGNAGNGVNVRMGGGLLDMHNCGSTVANLGAYGVKVDDGMQVVVDAATSTTNPGAGNGLRGATSDTKTGNLAAQTWAAFVGGGGNTADYAGATATGARLTQK